MYLGSRAEAKRWSGSFGAVADAYDSMTHPHTQRPAMPPAMAVDEIERCKARQFDPDCVDAMGAVLVEAMEREATDAAV